MAGEIDVAGIAGSSMRAAARGAPLKANFFPYHKSLFVLLGAPTSSVFKICAARSSAPPAPGRPPKSRQHGLAGQRHGSKKDVTFMTIGGAETSIAAMRNGVIHARAFNPDARSS